MTSEFRDGTPIAVPAVKRKRKFARLRSRLQVSGALFAGSVAALLMAYFHIL
jgi:hypothetical protein